MLDCITLKDCGFSALNLIDTSRYFFSLLLIQFGSLAAQVFRYHSEWAFESKRVPVQILQHYSDGGRGECVCLNWESQWFSVSVVSFCSVVTWVLGVYFCCAIVFMSADWEQIQSSVKTNRDWVAIWSEKRADGGQQGPAGLWLQIIHLL